MSNREATLTAANIRYFLALNELDDGETGARSSDIARHLGVTKPSVHTMIRKFCEKEYVAKKKYGTMHLTDSGKQLAERYSKQLELLCSRMELSPGLTPGATALWSALSYHGRGQPVWSIHLRDNPRMQNNIQISYQQHFEHTCRIYRRTDNRRIIGASSSYMKSKLIQRSFFLKRCPCGTISSISILCIPIWPLMRPSSSIATTLFYHAGSGLATLSTGLIFTLSRFQHVSAFYKEKSASFETDCGASILHYLEVYTIFGIDSY